MASQTVPLSVAPAYSGPAASLLASGPLTGVVSAAERIGVKISSKTALRWCLHGRRGERLLSVKVAGRRMTTVAALIAWLDRTATLPKHEADPGIDADGAERVLKGFGLGRGRRGRAN